MPITPVYYHSGYWRHRGRDHAGTPLPIGKSLTWGREVWHVPAVYLCGQGLVLDLCAQIQRDAMARFLDRWLPHLEQEAHLTRAQRRQCEQENPLSQDVTLQAQVNGKTLHCRSSCGLGYIPPDLLPDTQSAPPEALALLDHYQLDATVPWHFQRYCFPWATRRKPKVRSLSLILSQRPVELTALSFTDPQPGDQLTIPHPLGKPSAHLTVLDIAREEADLRAMGSGYLTCYTALQYTVEPATPNLRIQDTTDSDPQRRHPTDPYAPDSHASIGIIGGADGPTAIVLTNKPEPQRQTACSALHFTHPDHITWQAVFHEKLREDAIFPLHDNC